MRFTLQNYNEYHDADGIKFHDFVAVVINQFPVLLIRRFDFGMHAEEQTIVHTVQILGFTVFHSQKKV